MRFVPPDVKTWLAEATVTDVKSVLAGYLYDGATLDKSDIADIRRTVVCDSVILGISKNQLLLPMLFSAKVKSTTEIPGYFLGVMERSLKLKSPPLVFVKNPLRTAARIAHQLDQIVEKRLELTSICVQNLNSVNTPKLELIPQHDADLQ